MQYHFLDENEVAAYLHLTPPEVRRRVKYHEIPFATRGKRLVFPKEEIDSWASQRILNLASPKLADYHRRSTHDTLPLLPQSVVLPQMLDPNFVAPAMTAKTRTSVLRELVRLAEQTGRLNDPKALLQSLVEREKRGSTAMPGGFALPHPLYSDRYLFASSFIIIGRTIQPLHFGAPDGLPTTIFFLICCQDDRLHLHLLARLCLLARTPNLLYSMNVATDAAAIFQSIVTAECESLPEACSSSA